MLCLLLWTDAQALVHAALKQLGQAARLAPASPAASGPAGLRSFLDGLNLEVSADEGEDEALEVLHTVDQLLCLVVGMEPCSIQTTQLAFQPGIHSVFLTIAPPVVQGKLGKGSN
jgi:hypothetical protein